MGTFFVKEIGYKLGFVGLRPKCKMQNAKCKIKERETVRGVSSKNDYPMLDNAFSAVSSQNLTIKQAFAIAKGFIHFAFCILHFAFCILKLPDKLQFELLIT